jgi:signal transduction histidine kinase/DNA-binding response OmpR family regulator
MTAHKHFPHTPILLFTFLGMMCLSCFSGAKPPKFLIGFSQCCDDAWRDVMNQEIYRELSFYPDLAIKLMGAKGSSEVQVQQIRELANSGIDILIVAPNESQPLTAVIEEVYRKGIPVILIDRKTDSEHYSAYIGGDNYKIGLTAARYIADKLGGVGKVLEVQMPMTISAAIERHRGFRDGIREAPAMQVIGVYETPIYLNNELEKLKKLFLEHPDANVLYGHTDLLAETAWKAAKELGLTENFFFVGIDGIPGTGQGIQAVEDGILDASLLYPTGGSEAVKLAFTILNGLPFDKINFLETTVIHAGNAAILHSQMKKEASLQESIDKQIKALQELNSIYRDQRVYIIVLISSLLLVMLLGGVLWQSLRSKQRINRDLETKTQEAIAHEAQIIDMSDELKKATQAKVDFFTNISHEFRTPLTLILGFAEDLLPSSKLNKETQESIGFIRQNAWRLLRLVNQLMDFRKIESERMLLRASENDLTLFVRDAMKSFGKVAEKRKIDFQLIVRNEHLMVWFDPAMLDKVLFNLLSNAFKFTPDGGKIHLSIHVDTFENQVKILVEDSGIGMNAEETAHVFEVFYQGADSQKAGTGLGLSLSKALVELHQGSLSVSSIKGKGSRFTVQLPLGKEHLREDQITLETSPYVFSETLANELVNESEGTSISSPSLQKADQQILIIEDNLDLQLFLKRSLGSTYQIVSANDGQTGLQLALDTVPDLILCDIVMPGMDGLQVVKALKSDLRASHIPVILLTARGTVEQQIEGAAAGADAYITKPFNIQYLHSQIRSLLHNRQILKESYGQGLLSFPESGAEMPANSSLDKVFIQKFTNYIETHHARQDFQVTDLCQEMNLSRSQLYRKVKALFGESITDYIQQVRLEKARALLLEGQMTVAEIAYQVGYSSPDYFSTVFRSKYGVAPTQLKKMG